MNFENQNGLAVDGLAGKEVWTALLADIASGKVNADPYTYVFVSKQLPESLTLYENGAPKFVGHPGEHRRPGADTTDGTYPVFEHVVSSRMQGTNPGRHQVQRSRRPVGQLLQRWGCAPRLRSCHLRLPPEQRLRRDVHRGCGPGLAADPHRHTGDGGRACLLTGSFGLEYAGAWGPTIVCPAWYSQTDPNEGCWKAAWLPRMARRPRSAASVELCYSEVTT